MTPTRFRLLVAGLLFIGVVIVALTLPLPLSLIHI